LLDVEAARRADDPDALDYILRGRAILSKPLSRDNYAKAISLYEQALAVDPPSIDARSLLAAALAGRVLDQMTDSAAADMERAEALTSEVLTASLRSPRGHLAKGLLLRAQNRFEEAIVEFERALEANHNWVKALGLLGSASCW
jgi:adenylate cyclase